MESLQRVAQFNRQLDRILQGLSPTRGNLTAEDRETLTFARLLSQIDLSKQNKTQQNLRCRLDELAASRLHHACNLSPSLIFRPKGFIWIGLAVLVQLVLGSIFGSMIALSYSSAPIQSINIITPRAELAHTQSPVINPPRWTAQELTECKDQQIEDHPLPVPTPLASPINIILPQGLVVSSETPLNVVNP